MSKMIDTRIHSQYYLKSCIQKGIAYHFGGIPDEIKMRVEELYGEGAIKVLFCTSTLLEGVNFPAKNIFILSEKIGLSKMTDIDFWNLAGRAGRLTKDLSGNIFCVNLYKERGYWNDGKIDVLRKKEIKESEPTIMAKNNQNLYKNITNYYRQKEFTKKNMSENDKKIIEMYGNILIYHDSINSDSILKNSFIDEGVNSLDALKKVRIEYQIPEKVLAESIEIDIRIQSNVFKKENEPLPENTSYQDCLKVLNILYREYDWEATESKGPDPMITSHQQLRYYAYLMEGWINSNPLKYLIQSTIQYYYNSGDSRCFYLTGGGSRRRVKFVNNNPEHINSVINKLMKDLENVIKFKVKSYINNYQSLLNSKGISFEHDWVDFLDYGSTNPEIIQIQDLGFSRTIAIFLSKEFTEVLIRNEEGIIENIDEELLKQRLDKEKHYDEYKELNNLLDWKEETK